MQKNSLSNTLKSPLRGLMGILIGAVPQSKEPGKAPNPAERCQEIVQKACLKVAAVSGGLALPMGPLSALTVAPDLLIVWRIQAQMVVDMAVALGHEQPLIKREILYCLFSHVSSGTALHGYEPAAALNFQRRSNPSLFNLINGATREGRRGIAVRASKQIGQVLLKRFAKRTASRIVPLAGAAIVSAYAVQDTREVARTAIDMYTPTVPSI